MRKFKKTEKIMMAAIGAAVLAAAVQRGFVANVSSKAKVIQQQIKLEEAKLKAAIELQKSKDSILAESAGCKALSEIRPDASARDIVAKFLNEVEKIAHDAEVSVLNLSPQAEAVGSKEYRVFKADLRAEATAEQLINFLDRIQKSNLLIKLDKFSISPKDEQAVVLRLETTISITVP
jgi:hypothetical protein